MGTEKSQDYLVTGLVFWSLKIVFTELQSTNNLRDRQDISLLMILNEFQKSSESLEVN